MSIKSSIQDGIATLEIARPEKKNALTAAMYQSLTDALLAAQADPSVRAILLIGQPNIFTAGNDLEDFMQRPSEGPEAPVFRFMQALTGCELPVIAAVTGAAIGIGTTLLLHCDLVYLSEDARLQMPFVNLGLVPEFASSLLLPQRLGAAKANEKLLLGDPITPTEAVNAGIANAVLPVAQVIPHARQVAARFAALPKGAVRHSKQLLSAPQAKQVAETIERERVIFEQRLKSPEAKEAFAAFFERRKPNFNG
ncbi:MAG: enoyl-CoA hydratase [Myxococcales bacterium]